VALGDPNKTMYSAWYICFNVRGSSSTSACSSYDKEKYDKLRLHYNKRLILIDIYFMFWVFQKGPKDIFSA